MHPDFQRAGLFVPLMAARCAAWRCSPGTATCSARATTSCSAMYRDMGFERARGADRRAQARLALPLAPDRRSTPSGCCATPPSRTVAAWLGDRLRRPARRGHRPASLAAAAARRDVTTFRPVLSTRGAGHPAALVALAADPASWSSTSWRRSSSSSSRARAARRARGRAAARRGRARCSTAASRPRSARGSSIRGAAGSCTSCPSRCTASCAWTATATRSPPDEQERLARAARRRRRPVGRARGRVDAGARGHRRRAAARRLRRARPLEPQPRRGRRRRRRREQGRAGRARGRRARSRTSASSRSRAASTRTTIADVRRAAPTWSSTSATTWR